MLLLKQLLQCIVTLRSTIIELIFITTIFKFFFIITLNSMAQMLIFLYWPVAHPTCSFEWGKLKHFRVNHPLCTKYLQISSKTFCKLLSFILRKQPSDPFLEYLKIRPYMFIFVHTQLTFSIAADIKDFCLLCNIYYFSHHLTLCVELVQFGLCY